jgi:autotransporter adhesin
VGSAGTERQIQNVAAGQLSATSTDAVNGSQLFATNQAVNSIVSGGGIKYFHANSQAADSQAVGIESVAIGPQAVSRGTGAVALGNGTQANSSNGVALGAGAVADRGGMNGQREAFSNVEVQSAQGAVSVGNAGSERQITNVAGGTEATDAVNVRQLQASQQTAVSTANNYTDARINGLGNQLHQATRMLSGGIAASAAMAVVTPVEPGRFHLSGAVAGYNGQVGIGLNLLKRSENGQTTLHTGVGWGSGGSKAIIRAGFGFTFD